MLRVRESSLGLSMLRSLGLYDRGHPASMMARLISATMPAFGWRTRRAAATLGKPPREFSTCLKPQQ